jgi:hypothetical protein
LVLFLVLVQIGFYGEDVVHIWEREICKLYMLEWVYTIFI